MSEIGYWLVSRNGSVFPAGDARSFGTLPGLNVNVSDIVAIAPTGDGKGYWMIGRDGGEFAFGDAHYNGSLPGEHIHVSDVVGLALTPPTLGYWFAGANGVTYPFGDAKNLQVSSSVGGDLPVVGIAAS